MMFKIGLIGTENTHALAFAKYYNLPNEAGKYNEEDMRVTAIMGYDQEANAKIMAETGVDFVATSVEEMIDKVDAVMITSRKGSEHMQYALPFIERKMPVFIDKPFTSDPVEADALMAKIKEYNCPVQGGSSCKYLPEVKQVKELVEKLRAEDNFMGASIGFRIVLDSEHDGIYFYAPHLVEMCLECFGTDIKKVQALRNQDKLIVNVMYEKDLISLQYTTKGRPSCLVYGGKAGNFFIDMNTNGLYELECKPFAELVRGEGESLPAQTLVQPIHMIDAIKRSMESGQIVEL